MIAMILFAAVTLSSTLTVNAVVITTLIGTVLPILVDFATKLAAPDWVRADLLLLFSIVSATLTNALVVDGSAILSTQTILLALLTWISGVVSYKAALKPNGITQGVRAKTASFGIGPTA
jgi:hypothetical protein